MLRSFVAPSVSRSVLYHRIAALEMNLLAVVHPAKSNSSPKVSPLSNAFRRRIPDEFVQLQAQTHGEAIGQNPLRERARIERGPGAQRVGKYRGK